MNETDPTPTSPTPSDTSSSSSGGWKDLTPPPASQQNQDSPTASYDDEAKKRYYAKLWRKQFLKNPFKLGPPGIIVGLCCLLFIAFWVAGVAYNSLEAADAGDYTPATSGMQRTGAWISAALCFGILYIFMFIVSLPCSAKTQAWLAKKGKTLEDILK